VTTISSPASTRRMRSSRQILASVMLTVVERRRAMEATCIALRASARLDRVGRDSEGDRSVLVTLASSQRCYQQ
jgi:hypothetical protein